MGNGVQGVAGSNPAVPTWAPQQFRVLWGLLGFAESQSGRPDSAGSPKAATRRPTESGDRTVGSSRASARLSIDPDVLRETSGGRRRRPELNPGGGGGAVSSFFRGSRSGYGSGRGPKSGGGMRRFVLASYADAMRKSVGSPNGRARKSIPTGSRAGTGPVRRVLSGAVRSRSRS